jgi:hypothetical protein
MTSREPLGNPLFARLPARFRWTFHNMVGHPLSEIAYQLGAHRLSGWLHDWTVPLEVPRE